MNSHEGIQAGLHHPNGATTHQLVQPTQAPQPVPAPPPPSTPNKKGRLPPRQPARNFTGSAQLDSAPSVAAFCLKVSLPSSTETLIGSFSCRLPRRISSDSGSSR